jgi:hypothetical protein
VLLAVFVSAVAFVLTAAVWQPWDSEDPPAEVVIQEPAGDEPAADGETLTE